MFELNTDIRLLANAPLDYQIVWSGVDSFDGSFATVKMNSDRFVTVEIILVPTPTPPPTATPVPPVGEYTNIANDFSIDIGPGWSVEESTSKVTISSSDRGALLNITRWGRAYSLEQLADLSSETVISDPIHVQGSLTRSSVDLDSGSRGIRLSYRNDGEAGFCEAAIENIYVFLGSEAYSLYGSVCLSATDKHLENLRRMYKSFRAP